MMKSKLTINHFSEFLSNKQVKEKDRKGVLRSSTKIVSDEMLNGKGDPLEVFVSKLKVLEVVNRLVHQTQDKRFKLQH